MSHSKNLQTAKSEFLSYYQNLLPQFSNVSILENYLTTKNTPVLLFSPVFHDQIIELWRQHRLTLHPVNWFPYAYYWPQKVQPGTSLPGFSQGWIYALNISSLLPILTLNPQSDDVILDASAAPGGKTLAILSLSYPNLPFIVANDVSVPRYKRLKTVLKLFGFPQILVTCSPIQSLVHTTDIRFTKILLDAPCSSEKHVYNSKRHLRIWSPKRSENLAHLQRLLIDSLIPLLSPNGQLIYSTCALNPRENESVISNTLTSHSDVRLEQLPVSIPVNSPCLENYGLTPSQISQVIRTSPENTNFDPVFVAKILKIDKN